MTLNQVSLSKGKPLVNPTLQVITSRKGKNMPKTRKVKRKAPSVSSGRKITTLRGVTSSIFECDCGERWEGEREKAYRHAKKTGHKVNGEVVITYRYN